MLNNIDNELVVGLVGGLGVDFDAVAKKLVTLLQRAGYHGVEIRIADNFVQRNNPSKFADCYWKMQYATKHRQNHGKDYWAVQAVNTIFNLRPKLANKHKKIAYIIRSLKTRHELEKLNDIYGKNFLAISIFCEDDVAEKNLRNKLALGRININKAKEQMQDINRELCLGADKLPDHENLAKFLLQKDQTETHPELQEFGQNLFSCYSRANFFLYQNKNLSQQMQRFVNLLFNDPFAEPTYEEYFMFCAQAAAYRSLDLDRQVGAVIVNQEHEMVASGFNDVSKVGGGHFFHHDHPMQTKPDSIEDQRDFLQEYDFNHKYLDKITANLASKLQLNAKDQLIMREQIREITEFKRSTHAEMSALLDASRRGVAVRDCTMYVNTYPCHNCTKHIMAAGIKRIVFLHPYTKSKAREMYASMIEHGLLVPEQLKDYRLVFEPFLGVSPNRFAFTFANDKDTRLERDIDGRENGKPVKWELSTAAIPSELVNRKPYSYIAEEWAIINNKDPDMATFYQE